MELYTYEELKNFVDHCERCPLSQTRNKAVMGKGNLHSSSVNRLYEAGGDLSYQYREVPSAGQPGSASAGAGGVYAVSEI